MSFTLLTDYGLTAATPPQRRVKPPRRPMKDTCQWTTVVNLKMIMDFEKHKWVKDKEYHNHTVCRYPNIIVMKVVDYGF